MALVWRFFVVIFAYFIASLAAGITLTIGVLQTYPLSPPTEWEMFFFWGAAYAINAVVLIFAFLPAVLIILLAEGLRWRSVLISAIAGGAIGLAYSLGAPDPQPGHRAIELMTAAGIVAGIVYWAIAGRNAGAWRNGR